MNDASISDPAKIAFEAIIVFSSSIGAFSALAMFALIMFHVIKMKNSPNRTPLLLTTNMYFSIFLFNTSILDIYAHSLSKRVHLQPDDDELRCRIRGYFFTMAGGGMFYSNMLQAMFRVCRVVLHHHRWLQNFRLYGILAVVQWILAFIIVLPNYLWNDFVYFPDDFQCHITFFNPRSLFYNMLALYFIPIFLTIGSYAYTVRKTRRLNNLVRDNTSPTQRVMSQRDIIVLSRICILQIPMLSFLIPVTIVVILIALGYQYWWFFHIQWFVFTISMASVNVILVYVSPQVRNLFPAICKGQVAAENVLRREIRAPVS